MNFHKHIENEIAYEAGRTRNIWRNATTGRRKRWIAADPSREKLMVDFDLIFNSSAHPSKFMSDMLERFDEWGELSPAQEAAVRRTVEGRAAQKVARQVEDASSGHVGTIGERRNFTLTVTFTTSFETDYGTMFITGFKDVDKNIFIYKGKALEIARGDFFEPVVRGDTVTLKATIKAHGERDGVKQTIISRPKVLE